MRVARQARREEVDTVWGIGERVPPPPSPLFLCSCVAFVPRLAHVSTPLTVQDISSSSASLKRHRRAVAVVVVVVCSNVAVKISKSLFSKNEFFSQRTKNTCESSTRVTYFSTPLRSELSEKEVRVVTANGNKKFFPKLLSAFRRQNSDSHPCLQ